LEMAVTILAVTAVLLVGVIVWLLWTTIRVSGSVRRSRQNGSSGGNPTRTNRLDAELFVETYRPNRKRNDREE
jgi:hypothetical protein